LARTGSIVAVAGLVRAGSIVAVAGLGRAGSIVVAVAGQTVAGSMTVLGIAGLAGFGTFGSDLDYTEEVSKRSFKS
jgi:hypothetical protein